jgi:hypothetical protein
MKSAAAMKTFPAEASALKREGKGSTEERMEAIRNKTNKGRDRYFPLFSLPDRDKKDDRCYPERSGQFHDVAV